MNKRMPKKKSTYLDLKQLGSLREKIVFQLSENPNLNAQAVQKNLGYPSNQYPNVLNALKTLEKLELLTSKRSKSKKNVPIKLYRCTFDGVLFTLAENPKASVLSVLNAYQSLDKNSNFFRKLYDIWGHEHFMAFVRYFHEYLPVIHKNGLAKVIPMMLMTAARETQNLDQDTKIEKSSETIKLFPEAEEALKEWGDSINKVLQKSKQRRSQHMTQQ
jgi:hypothetical protein